jgi:hypothetical protein
MKLNEKGTTLIEEVGGESEPRLAKLSAASLPGIPLWAGVHTTETECEEHRLSSASLVDRTDCDEMVELLSALIAA